MLYNKDFKEIITVAARDSQLSCIQVEEIFRLLSPLAPHIAFKVYPMKTQGDIDTKTSLKQLEIANFFTDTLDDMLLEKKCRIAIHSAKDLPTLLPSGLRAVALTQGLDPRDALVWSTHPRHTPLRIGTSSIRRDQIIQTLFPTAICCDIRGAIQQRLDYLNNDLDAVVIAQAALIRLNLTHLPHEILPGPTHPLQGKLAVIARADDEEMLHLFKLIHGL